MKLKSDGSYSFTGKEHGLCMALWMTVCMGVGWLFYDNVLLGIASIPTYGVFYKMGYQYKIHLCQRKLRSEFKDMMLSVYSSLSAGTTLEESIRRAMTDLERSLDSESRMVQELILVCHKMERNVPIGQCLEEMAKRCNYADMSSFFQVLSIGKRQGGNMAQLVRDSVEKIQRRIEISYEIEGIIGAKRGEFLFMCLIPLGIIIYMRLFSPEFMEVLYTGIAGRMCMTGCLGVYVVSVLLGFTILKIN